MAIVTWDTGLLVLVTVGTLVLLYRVRSRSAGVMALGATIVWVAIALATFGPKTSAQIPDEVQESLSQDGRLSEITELREPVLPIGLIVSMGATVFGIGFLGHALTASRR